MHHEFKVSLGHVRPWLNQKMSTQLNHLHIPSILNRNILFDVLVKMCDTCQPEITGGGGAVCTIHKDGDGAVCTVPT